jgi:arginyl-tRNA synthetase
MKQLLEHLIIQALTSAHENGLFTSPAFPDFVIEVPKNISHGDYSSNIAMVSAAIQKISPRKIAESIIRHIQDTQGVIDHVDIAGPGFINFYLRPESWIRFLKRVPELGSRYGSENIGNGKKIQVEFVSSNPTGPLHVGHGRGAAVGDSVSNILSFCGYDVQKEYYINDSGRQINTLGRSVFLRYQELLGESVRFPDDCYQGDYIRDIAGRIMDMKGPDLLDQPDEKAVMFCARYAADLILEDMKQDLESFGVFFDRWFSEQGLYDSGKVADVIESFRNRNIIYEKDGALWFDTTSHGDEKDRVVVRNNGQTTYFASDIAYHYDKYDRGFEKVIDVWGADHHGYIPRVTAAIVSGGYRKEQFQVVLVQLVSLLRAGMPVAMSTRAGEFVTLRDVIQEVGRDAARFIFLTRSSDNTLEFDLELAKQKTNDNPVYYVQYVHARICSIVRKSTEMGISVIVPDDAALCLLNTPEDIALIKMMIKYPEIVRSSAELLEPHRITFYLMELAASFHAYYNRQRVLTDDIPLTLARLYLMKAVRQVIANGLSLLGVSAPESM